MYKIIKENKKIKLFILSIQMLEMDKSQVYLTKLYFDKLVGHIDFLECNMNSFIYVQLSLLATLWCIYPSTALKHLTGKIIWS
jgi:hypothetical protein